MSAIAWQFPFDRFELAATPVPLVIFLSTVIVVVLHLLFFYDARRRKLPPGPKGWPIIGNTFQISLNNNPEPTLIAWAKKYGEIYYARLGSTDFIFLNSGRVVKELFDRRGSVYSDKPYMPMAGEALTRGLNLSLMPYNQRWKVNAKNKDTNTNLQAHRRLMQGVLTQKQAETYRPIQQFESQQLAVDWLDSPENYYQHNRRYAFSLIMQVVYGRRFPKWGSTEAEGIYSVNRHLSSVVSPGAYIVDTFPFLAKIPGFGTVIGSWKKVGDKLFEEDSQVLLGYYRKMKNELARSVGYPCFARDLEESLPASQGMDEVESAFLAGGLVMPGAESTSALLNWLVRALATWPQVQIEAREELDRVVGFDRTPRWEDEQSLPYIRAMVKELIRWALGSRFGIVHSTTQDDWFGFCFNE
jgi:cytochrome P450